MTAQRVLAADPKLLERFMAKVEIRPNGCWIWTAGRAPNGYGVLQVKLADGRWVSEYAHRVSWALAHGGALPTKNACHDCPGGDDPACVCPSHLWEGSHAQNIADRDAKGRTARGAAVVPPTRPKGEDHYEARVDEDDVRMIRHAAASGKVTLQDLADRYHMTRQAIWRIVHRKTWKHVV